MLPVYANTGINMRYSVRSYDWSAPNRAGAFESFLAGAVAFGGFGRALDRPDWRLTRSTQLS
jgi:hypothetical protein